MVNHRCARCKRYNLKFVQMSIKPTYTLPSWLYSTKNSLTVGVLFLLVHGLVKKRQNAENFERYCQMAWYHAYYFYLFTTNPYNFRIG
jgi:hypothetical protein